MLQPPELFVGDKLVFNKVRGLTSYVQSHKNVVTRVKIIQIHLKASPCSIVYIQIQRIKMVLSPKLPFHPCYVIIEFNYSRLALPTLSLNGTLALAANGG